MAGKPEVARLIEDQSRGRGQRNALFGPKTLHRAFLHPTERRAFVRHLRSSDPDVSLSVLDNRVRAIGQILVHGELPVLPSSQPSCRSDPQASVTRTQQGKNLIVRKLLSSWRDEGNETHAVEPNQTAFGSDPEIAVLGGQYRPGYPANSRPECATHCDRIERFFATGQGAGRLRTSGG